MEAGSGPESARAPPTSVATSRKKSLVEPWIGPGIVIWIELEIACMQHPSKILDYHHGGASPGPPCQNFAPGFQGQTHKFLPYIAISPTLRKRAAKPREYFQLLAEKE